VTDNGQRKKNAYEFSGKVSDSKTPRKFSKHVRLTKCYSRCHKNGFFVCLKCTKIFAVGAPYQTQLGKPTTLPRPKFVGEATEGRERRGEGDGNRERVEILE